MTFDIFEAETQGAEDVEHDFDTFAVRGDWREDAEHSSLVGSMQGFREPIKGTQEAAPW